MNAPQQVPMADVGDMHMVHTMLRREFTFLPALIRKVSTADVKRRSLLGMHTALLCRVLHTHHDAEDAVLWPLLLARAAKESEQIVTIMETQHQQIANVHDKVIEGLHDWRSSGHGSEQFATLLARLLSVMTDHMALEEKEVLPLAEKYITGAEWLTLGQHGMDTFPKQQLPLAFGMMMYEGDPEVIARTLAHTPPAVRLLMPVVAPRAFRRHARRLYGTPTPPKAA